MADVVTSGAAGSVLRDVVQYARVVCVYRLGVEANSVKVCVFRSSLRPAKCTLQASSWFRGIVVN